MPLTYIPLNISKCCEYLDIPNTKYVNKYIYNKFVDFYSNKFCPYEIIKPNGEYVICGKRIKEENIYCKQHYNNNENKEVKQIFYCIGKSRRKKYGCGRIVKNSNEFCCFHNKDKKLKNNKKELEIYSDIKNVINNSFNTNLLYNIVDKIKRKNILMNKLKFLCLFLVYRKKIEIKNKINEDIKDIVKYSFNTNSLYKIVNNIKKDNENFGNKYYERIIDEKEAVLLRTTGIFGNTVNMKIIPYNVYGYETINKYTNDKIKRYIKNKKKNMKKKKNNKKNEVVMDIDVKNDIKLNPFIIENTLHFIDTFIGENKGKKDLSNSIHILSFLKKIKNNTYLQFYSNFIKINIDKLLDLKINTKINTEKLIYKKVIIFNKFNKNSNKNNDINYILSEIIYEISEIPHKTISWFGDISSIYDYTNKYVIDIVKEGINIYRKDDIQKKNKLDIDKLHIFYC